MNTIDVCTEMPPQKVKEKSTRIIDKTDINFQTFYESNKWLNIEQVKNSFDELYLKLKNENNL
jgi:predicted phage-related endonuclease